MVNKIGIEGYAVVVDALVKMIIVPLGIRYRERTKPCLDLHFGFYISFVIFLELRPFIVGVVRMITPSSAVDSGRLTRFAKITYKVFADSKFLLFKTENGSYLFKGKRQTEGCRPYHRAIPRIGTYILSVAHTEKPRQAYTLKLRIKSEFAYIFIRKSINNILGDAFTAGNVNNLDLSTIDSVSKKQNLKVRTLCVAVDSRFG